MRARLERLQPERGMRPLANDPLGMRGGDLLDVHAAGLARHDDVSALRPAVQRVAARYSSWTDRGRLLDEDLEDRDPLGRRLGRPEPHPEDLPGRRLGRRRVVSHLHAAGLYRGRPRGPGPSRRRGRRGARRRVRASAGVAATSPRGTGTPNSRRIAFAWYSWIFMRAPGTGRSAEGRRATYRPASGAPTAPGRSGRSTTRSFSGMIALSVILMCSGQTSVQHFVMLQKPMPARVPDELAAVSGVERVHVELGAARTKKRGPKNSRLVLLVVADDVADVLAEEALDALPELLAAVDVLLHHPAACRRHRAAGAERRDLSRGLVVERHVGDQVADERERSQRRHRDGLALGKISHPGHAHQAAACR